MTWRPWREAMQLALYGPDGFYRREAPAEHFRTSVTAGPMFARAVRRLAELVDEALGWPDPFDLVDVGTGRGELLEAMEALPDVPPRWRLLGVDLGAGWPSEIPLLTGLMFANEWLDNVPLDVTFDGRSVETALDGTERLGPPATEEMIAWAKRWWPDRRRIEIGLTRDTAWVHAVSRVQRGLAVAVDYGHTTADRRTSLTGYRNGHDVAPVPDGSCDLTAHVALDSCSAATGARVVRQREALSLLGISAARPDRSIADTDPYGYLTLLQEAGAAAELLDPRGLGAFGWLVQPVGIEDPLR
jgi:SAM-dependent MidA family methyltransferase